jgi:hypothetical protein
MAELSPEIINSAAAAFRFARLLKWISSEWGIKLTSEVEIPVMLATGQLELIRSPVFSFCPE